MARVSYTGPRPAQVQQIVRLLDGEKLSCRPFQADYDDLDAARAALLRLLARHGQGPDPHRLLGHTS